MQIKLVNLTKSFPGDAKKNIPDTVAVDHLNIDIQDGEFTIRTSKARDWFGFPKLCFISAYECL